jgi:hypothetical protein
VCGKTPETAYLQDLLTYSIKGLACWTDFAAKQGVEVPAEVYSFLHAATFATLTNVNFDDARFKVRTEGSWLARVWGPTHIRRVRCKGFSSPCNSVHFRAMHPHNSPLSAPPFLPPQEYVNQCHELRDGIEALVRAKGVEASPVTPSNLPWFDLLAHPAA